MRKKAGWLTALVVAMMLALPGWAEQKNAVSKGNIWIDGTASFQSFSGDFDYSLFTLSANGLYFVIDHLGVGGGAFIYSFEADEHDFNDFTTVGLAGKVIYAFDNFADKNIYPFAGGSIGFGFISDGDSDSGFLLELGGGMNYLLRNNLGVKAELVFRTGSYGDIDYSGFALNVGLIGVL